MLKGVTFHIGDVVIMKKAHPCGGNVFRILRVGSDVRIVCETCGRDMTIERVKLEKSIKKMICSESEDNR